MPLGSIRTSTALRLRAGFSGDWQSQAVCREEDPELFFPVGETGVALLQIEEAKAVCRRCPVADECGAFALTTRQDEGVWGGMSPADRRAVLRRAQRTRRAAA